jgi:hypothetical protein
LDELKSLVQRLIERWDAWMDTDTWEGPEYDMVAAAVEALRLYLQHAS